MKYLTMAATAVAFLIPSLAAAETMTATEIRQKIIGHSFEARRRGMRAAMTYGSDGNVALKTFLFTAEGTWRLSQNQLCVNITKGPQKGESCVTLSDQGNGTYLASDGATLKSIGQ